MASLVTVVGATQARAASTWTVDTPDDELDNDGDCSLREAIQSANDNADYDECGTAGGTPHTIEFDDDTEEYVITEDGDDDDTNATGDFDIETEIIIRGGDVTDTTIDGGGPTSFGVCGVDKTDASDRVFHVLTNGDLTLQDLTVEHGRVEDSVTGSEFGGGIWNELGDLSLDGVEVSNNSVCDSDDDDASGGGIASSAGTLSLTESTIANNDAIVAGAGDAQGGGIWHSGTSLDIEDSTLNGNVATGDAASSHGGAIWADQAGDLQNTTISGNDADVGGGIYYDGTNAVDLDLEHVTVTNNDDGGIVADNDTGEVNLEFSLIGDQDAGDDCEELNTGIINADGDNLDSDGTCDGADESNDINLDSLDDNGGPTETHLPDSDSDAVDHIDDADCSSIDQDQRGEDRPEDNNANCDAGAVERQDNESSGSGGSSSTSGDELDVTPETATNIVPGDLTHTLTAKFDEGELDSGDEDNIDWKIVSGPNAKGGNDPDFECSLSNDACTYTYTGNGQVGTDVICAWNDTDDDDNYTVTSSSSDGGNCDTETITTSGSNDNAFTDVVEKKWQTAASPTPTPTPTPSPTDGGGTTVIVESLVTIRFKRAKDLFKGDVLAGRRRCVSDRTVLLKKGKTTIGKDTTGSGGNWRVKAPGANGRYAAVATRKVFTAGNGDTVICARDRSKRIKV
jgi:CSLREA domain-containing protein